jgi:phosphoribosyl 1,2-cyclic phosphodiesterase
MDITFLGTNGSTAYNSGNRAKYGTNTSCVMVKAGGETLIFDAGTGISGAKDCGEKINIFLSHYHADHMAGLLFFPDFFNPKKKINIYASRDIINDFLSPPLSPVSGLEIFNAELSFHEIKSGQMIEVSSDVKIHVQEVSHPGSAFGFRIEHENKAVCFYPDIELANHQNDSNLIELTRNAELLIMDSYFDDGKIIPGWGHSSWRECAEWVKKCNVKKLALFHHDFKLTDADIDYMTEKTKEIFANTFAAADFMKIEI